MPRGGVRAYAVLALLCSSLLATSGCSQLSPELVAALSQDNASLCVTTDVRGGAGGMVGGATGGYGQGTLTLCRTSHPGATLLVKPDGTVFIKHD
jgi:hypothetical protein